MADKDGEKIEVKTLKTSDLKPADLSKAIEESANATPTTKAPEPEPEEGGGIPGFSPISLLIGLGLITLILLNNKQ